MRESQIDALVAAARDGVTHDGLVVSHGESNDSASSRNGGYSFRTPETTAVGLAERGLRKAARNHPRYVTNWYNWERTVGGHDTYRRAFLRWVEAADERSVPERYDALDAGAARTWGELRITASLDADGARTYELCHAADRNVETADLDGLDRPRDVRDLARFDDAGEFRPLKTAPTLPTGWRLSDLDGDGLVRAVGFVYPATVANWHFERQGDLDVTHFRATADRQTGIYECVTELDREAVGNAAIACCADDECLKRRAWDYDDGESLDAPRGDGEFPCREPCSLFVAAAREFARVEREAERNSGVELTPSEFDRVTSLPDAVADGRADEVRDGDVGDPANRFRTRYLRAKRFSDAEPEQDATDEREATPKKTK